MPPGYVQIAGGYYMIESGSCGGGLILRKSECAAAATALDLSDKTAFAPPTFYDYTGSRSPPGFVFHASGHLNIMGPDLSIDPHWACSSTHKCICKSYSPDSYSYDPFGQLGWGTVSYDP